MKIKSVSCEQFAGMRDRSIELDDGLNVVFGKNESGKSTFVNLMSSCLFQPAKINRKTDQTFLAHYFPSHQKDSAFEADYIDGEISIEDPTGVYRLKKEWSPTGWCRLTQGGQSTKDPAGIDEVMNKVLGYSKGVYSQILFSSQYNVKRALDNFLKTSAEAAADKPNSTEEKNEKIEIQKAKQDIIDVLTASFSETGGVSTDRLETEIDEKISKLQGSHWDIENNRPVRRNKGTERWSRDPGDVLRDYYALEDARGEREKLEKLEDSCDQAEKNLRQSRVMLEQAKGELDEFDRYRIPLQQKNTLTREAANLRKKREEEKTAIYQWPDLTQRAEKAEKLYTELQNSRLLEKYQRARKIKEELLVLKQKFQGKACPGAEEIRKAEGCTRQIQRLENKLKGMNLNAAIHMLNGQSAEIRILRTGEILPIQDGNIAIEEAVGIRIPGVMEMQLSPSSVDAAAVNEEIAELRKSRQEICRRYRADSEDELKALQEEFRKAENEILTCESALARCLGDDSYEELENEAGQIAGAIREANTVEGELRTVCENRNPVQYIANLKADIQQYEKKYADIESLRSISKNTVSELSKIEDRLGSLQNIPEKYRFVEDPEKYYNRLRSEWDRRNDDYTLQEKNKTAADTNLQVFLNGPSGGKDLEEEEKNCQRIFEESKASLHHWLHIREVFREQKEKLRCNPMQDIADSFAGYLREISGGNLSSEFLTADNLDMNIYSGNSLMDYDKLSEGTKETVSLAFRLAVLDHLFPKGGGVIVLDDPFTDMDMDRAARSCEMVKRCSERHQVIFLTCREDYLPMLGGKEIRI